MKLKNGKAAGADNISAEALKADIDTAVEMLLFARIWEDEELPADWKEGHLIKLPMSVNVPSAEEFVCCLCLEKFSTGSFWRE